VDDTFVAQVMTPDPPTVPPATAVETAVDPMLDDAIGSVLVVDDRDRLRGLRSRRLRPAGRGARPDADGCLDTCRPRSPRRHCRRSFGTPPTRQSRTASSPS